MRGPATCWTAGLHRRALAKRYGINPKTVAKWRKQFLLRLIAAVPYKIHTVLTDNGIQFTTPGAGGSAVPLIKEAIANGERFRAHAFEYTCVEVADREVHIIGEEQSA